jgi:FlaG/FlaF family flagellin (archaellin)
VIVVCVEANVFQSKQTRYSILMTSTTDQEHDGSSDPKSVPYLGVGLMVLTWMVLAAVIGMFVMGLGSHSDTPGPDTTIEFDHNATSNELSASLGEGESLTPGNTGAIVVVTDTEGNLEGSEWKNSNLVATGDADRVLIDGEIHPGEGIWGTETSSLPVKSGETVTVTWRSQDGDTSAILGEFTAP